MNQRNLGIHVGVNFGLFMFDGMYDRFYAFVAANGGVPLLMNGSFGAVIAGASYNTPLGRVSDSTWFMDLGAMVPSGWYHNGWYSGFGFTLGFRYLHRSGFTLGFKIPMFGMTFGNAITRAQYFGPQSVTVFYLASAVSLPIISLGYRF